MEPVAGLLRPGCLYLDAATAGNYLLSVTAEDGVTGTEVNTTAWYTVSGTPLTAVSVAASPTAPQAVEHAHYLHRDGDGRHQRAVSVLAV